MSDLYLLPKYTASYALVIGINAYAHVAPLQYARNDAEAIAALLVSDLGFPKENVFLLLDEEATAEKIRKAFCDFSWRSGDLNDRLFVFFAGHGYTQAGHRGEIGFLVPQDGKIDDLSTLVRWDEMTRNADLIAAKHILFMMDACYGGLALQRSGNAPGSIRFLKDMLLRRTRQVLTAGKADESVGDSGGPLPGHSVFTGHLIEGLQGRAATPDGIITGNGVMSYVYRMVATDVDSHQTPHYGFLDGDGDFIFKAEILETIARKEEADQDIMVAIPAAYIEDVQQQPELMERLKEYLSEPRYKIKLHGLVANEVRLYLAETANETFRTAGGHWSVEEFGRRLQAYNQCSANLRQICAAIAHWGDSDQVKLLPMILGRVAEDNQSGSGLMILSQVMPCPPDQNAQPRAAVPQSPYRRLPT